MLTQTFLTGTTMGNCDTSDESVRQKAIDACKDITHAIGVTLFRERFFHADPHPGNIMLALTRRPFPTVSELQGRVDGVNAPPRRRQRGRLSIYAPRGGVAAVS